MVKSFPLCWPDGWKRSGLGGEKNGRFTRYDKWVSVADSIQRVLESLQRMGIGRDDVVISTNIPTKLDGLPRSDQSEPQDRGVAVYWRKSSNAPMQCMAIDIYTTVADNLAAVAATLEALRAIERHGGAQVQERTFRGFAALPEKAGRPWRDVLGIVEARVTRDLIEHVFRNRARVVHPDLGGTDGEMAELNRAREEALMEVSGAA